jgi:Fic family protein
MKNNHGEQVVLFGPTPPYLVKPEMQAAIEWTNEQLESGATHPILAIANFIFEFLAIHPFRDGNGRISRALTNMLLLKAGYGYIPYVSLDEIIEKTRSEYYLALRATQKKHKTKNEDITPWVNYFLDALTEQADRARVLMENDQPEKMLSKKQLEIYRLFDSSKEIGIAEVVKLLKGKTPRATIKQALSRLVKLKLLEQIGQARSARYKKVEDGGSGSSS